MSAPKILAVVGATGQQGGSVITHVSGHSTLSKEYKIRAITRNPSKAKFGPEIEVVKADLDDIESLKAAFKGAHTVFGVTDYWSRCDKEYEKQQGINIADAAKAANVKHLIWSASTDCEKVSGGKLKDCEYFDNKAQVMEYIEQIKGGMTASFPTPGVFMQNFKREVQRDGDGNLIWPKPWDQHKTGIPYIDAHDSGMYVAGIMLQDPESVNGKKIVGMSEWICPQDALDIFSKESGQTVAFKEVSEEDFAKQLPKLFSHAVTGNMIWMRDYGFFGPGGENAREESDQVLGGFKPKSWKEYVQQNGPWQFD